MAVVTVERDTGVVTVTINRPERKNALTPEVVDSLCAACEEVGRRDDDRVMVLTGAGGDFCSGADLLAEDRPLLADAAGARDAVRHVGTSVLALYDLGKPTVAKVDGVAVGAGLGLALACDLVVASERARFSSIFVRRALSPDAGTSWLLPRLVGAARAKELALLGDMLDAGDAHRIGLVARVVAVPELDEAVRSLARRLAQGPALALAATKTLLNAAWSGTLADAVEREAELQSRNVTGPDVEEALRAFAERREPRWARGAGATPPEDSR